VSTAICQIQQSGPTAAVVQPASVQAQRHAALTLVPLEAPIAAPLVKLAAPNILVNIALSSVGLIETYFMGKLGRDAIAGVALVFQVVMLSQMMSAGAVGGGISSAVARALGGRRRRDADDLAHELADHTHAGQIQDGMRYDGSLSLLKVLAAIRELHPGIRVAEAPAQSPRISRKRWARELEKP